MQSGIRSIRNCIQTTEDDSDTIVYTGPKPISENKSHHESADASSQLSKSSRVVGKQQPYLRNISNVSELDASAQLRVRGNGILASVHDMNISEDVFATGCKLLLAVARGDLEKVQRYLVSTIITVHFRDYDRRTALHVASSEGHYDIVKFLVEKAGANVNRSDRWGGSPLDDAHRHQQAEVAAYLRSKGGKTGSADTTINLIHAAAAGNIDEVNMVLQDVGKAETSTAVSTATSGHVNVNQGDYDNRTALHLASSHCHANIVRALLDHGADVNCQDRWGSRPLDDALRSNAIECAELLRKMGGTIGTIDHKSDPLHASSLNRDLPYADMYIDLDELDMIDRVGSGAFGVIYKCRWRGTLVAAKCIRSAKISANWEAQKRQVRNITDIVDAEYEVEASTAMTEDEKEQALDDFRIEVSILKTLRHPNICMLLAYSTTEDLEVMVSELMKCSLLDVFKANAAHNQHLSKRKQIAYAQQLAQGMNYLHTCRPPIIHRDLKPANLLIDYAGMIKITDFGLAKVRPGPEEKNGTDPFIMTGETGSYRFMAPEVFKHEAYTELVDVYSYAMIFYNILSGAAPWPTMNGQTAAFAAAKEGLRPEIPRNWDARIGVLLKRCWDENSSRRPSFGQILEELSEYSKDVLKVQKDNVVVSEEAESSRTSCSCLIS